MTAQHRAAISILCRKYARVFGVSLDEVETRGIGDTEVYCASRPDLPVWSLGADSEDWQDDKSGRKMVSR